jgi:hypothetical protein
VLAFSFDLSSFATSEDIHFFHSIDPVEPVTRWLPPLGISGRYVVLSIMTTSPLLDLGNGISGISGWLIGSDRTLSTAAGV